MDPAKTATLSRSALYELVWTTPRSRLAATFGLSDVGLSKLCDRLAIPQPPRGYWAKLAVGKAPPRISLPDPDRDPKVDLRALSEEEVARRAQRQKEKEERDRRVKALPLIPVPARPTHPHPLVKATRVFFAQIPAQLKRDARRARLPYYEPREAPPSDNGRYWCLDGGAIPIKVSPEQSDRACRFLDALLKRLEREGFQLEVREPDPRSSPRDIGLVATRNGEACRLELVEGYSRVRLTDEELEELRKKDPYAGRTAQPNGRLKLTVTGVEYGGSNSWADGKSASLEDKLAEIVATLLDLNTGQPGLRQEARQEEEARARREAERLRQQNLADLRDKEFRALLKESRTAAELEDIERYLDRIANKLGPQGEGQTAWLVAMRTYIRLLDPLRERLESLRTIEAEEDLCQSLRDVTGNGSFLTALLDEDLFEPGTEASKYWRQYRRIQIERGADGPQS